MNDTPASATDTGHCEIRLKGHLDGRWADRLGGLAITLEGNGDTLLSGPVTDQAALHGLLRRASDFGVSLLSVNWVRPGRAEAADVRPSGSVRPIAGAKEKGEMNQSQKIGGMAALLHAAAYVVAIVLGVTLIFPILEADPGQYVAFVAGNRALVYVWNLIAYWGSAITLVVMALALYERLQAGASGLARTATVFGLIWAALIIGSGNLMLRDVGIIADLYGRDRAQAETVWLALEAVETGIVSGNELVGSLWVLLLSLAALRTRTLVRALNYLGVALGVAGILTLVPALVETTRMVFGPGMIVWSVWLGIVMLRQASDVAAPEPAALLSLRQTAGGE